MASMSTLAPIAALFSPQKAPVNTDVLLSSKRKPKSGVRMWRELFLRDRLVNATCTVNVENEEQPASVHTEHKASRTFVTQGHAEQRLLGTRNHV